MRTKADLEAADRRVDSLEDEVAVLRERLEAVRQAHDSSRERDRDEAEYREKVASGDGQELLDRHLVSELIRPIKVLPSFLSFFLFCV